MEPAGAPGPLQKTPLNSVHRSLGAKMVDFGGWDMPVEYSGIIAEHLAVRTRVGLFDVSHMGEIEIRGPQALELVQWVTPNDASRLADGQAQYSALLYPTGGFVEHAAVEGLAGLRELGDVVGDESREEFADAGAADIDHTHV